MSYDGDPLTYVVLNSAILLELDFFYGCITHPTFFRTVPSGYFGSVIITFVWKLIISPKGYNYTNLPFGPTTSSTG